jgi:hypothetical protein
VLATSSIAPTGGIRMMYTSGCPKIQKAFSHSHPVPPWPATKNEVPVTRSLIMEMKAINRAGMA